MSKSRKSGKSGRSVDEIYGAMGRGTLFFFDPFKLTVVGLDKPDGDNVLADPDRVGLGWDEGMVQSLLDVGMVSPVSFRKNGTRRDGSPNSEVVVGRDRVMSCREAWRRARASGVPEEDLPPVTAVLSKGSEEEDLLAIMLAENLVRRSEGPLSAARKAARLFRMTKDKKRTAFRCRVTVQTLDDWFAVLDLHPKVQAMVERGEVGAGNAVELLRGVQLEDQPAAMVELVAAGKVVGLAARSEVLRRRAGQPAPGSEGEEAAGEVEVLELPPKRAVRRFRAVLEDSPLDVGYTHKQVLGLVDFLLDGKPLRGPLRSVWSRAAEARAPGKK